VERAAAVRRRVQTAVELLFVEVFVVLGVPGVALVEVLLVDAALVAEQAGGHLLALLDVRSPGGVELKRRAVLELDHRAGEVFDRVVESALGGHFAGQRAVGAAHHPRRFRVAHQPERQVEPVDAEVDQRTAARLRLVEEPTAHGTAAAGVESGRQPRHSAAAQPDAPRIVDVAELARFDQILHRPRLRVEPVAEVDAELELKFLRRVEHLLRFGGIHRHRLLAEHVRPGFESGDGQILVLIVRNRDRQDVELLVPDHVDAFGIDLRRIVFLFRSFPSFFAAVGDGDDFDVGVRHVSGEVTPPHAETDDAGFQLGHDVSAPGTVVITCCCRRRSGRRPLWARPDRPCGFLRAPDISAHSFHGRRPASPSGPRCRSP